jgi:hypothetical protein
VGAPHAEETTVPDTKAAPDKPADTGDKPEQ